jgi:hypothetical protein
MKTLPLITMTLEFLLAGATVQAREADTEILLGGISLRMGISQGESLRSLGASHVGLIPTSGTRLKNSV